MGMIMAVRVTITTHDPHVWLSPARAIKLVEHIRDSLSADYPDKKETFEKNAAAYIEKLQALDKAYTDGLSQAKQKEFCNATRCL